MMGRCDESYEQRREREREERRQYEGDVFYDAWRRGLNPGRAVECAEDCYYAGRSPEQCVDGYAQRVRSERERRDAARQEEERQLYEAEQAHYAELDIREAEEAQQEAEQQRSTDGDCEGQP